MAIFPKYKQKPPKMAHHDLSHFLRTSMAPGCLVPILVDELVAGDQRIVDLTSLVETQALLSPLYGSYQLKIEAFFAGTSLYCPKLWRNGSMQTPDGILDANYPTFTLPEESRTGSEGSETFERFAVNSSSLLAYLGYPPNFSSICSTESTENLSHNAIPLLMYLDIFRHYYANRQEPQFPYISQYLTPTADDVTIKWQEMSRLDDLFLKLPVDGGDVTMLGGNPSTPGSYIISELLKAGHFPLGGFLQRTFMPDMMNVILSSDFFEKNINTVQVSTAGGSFQIDQFVTAKKLWNSRNKDAISSGTFKDWVRMHFGVTPKIMDDMPTFLGSTTSDIIFQDIRATTSASTPLGDQFLGDKGSSGRGSGSSRQFRFIADRPGYLMVIASIVPRVDYFQRLERWTQHRKLSDSFRPEFNGIGLQDVLVSDLTADFSGVDKDFILTNQDEIIDPRTISIGKQPAWINYMTAVNRIRGTLCTTEKSWVLARDFNVRDAKGGNYGAGPVDLVDPTAYIMPNHWNTPFALTNLTSQNFLVQFYIRHTSRSTVLKRLLPKF